MTDYVRSIKASKHCGNNNQYRVMNFTLSNDNGAVYHVTVWNEEIDRIEPDLILDSVCIYTAFLNFVPYYIH